MINPATMADYVAWVVVVEETSEEEEQGEREKRERERERQMVAFKADHHPRAYKSWYGSPSLGKSNANLCGVAVDR